MFDGINAFYKVAEKGSHLTRLSCWERLYYEATAKPVNEEKTAQIRGLNIALKPSINGSNFLIKGSLHKWFNSGEDNSDQFTFKDVQTAVYSLCFVFDIEPEKIELHGLEIGVNIKLPYPVLRLLNNLVCYKGKVFTPINERNLRLGFICCLTDYEIKIYDKGKQAGTPNENLLRLEIKVRKMRFINDYGFKFLEDLTNVNKAYSAKQIIMNILNSIIWTDNSANKKLLSNRELKQWLKYENPKTWQDLTGKDNLKNARNRWKYLLKKYGSPPDLLPLFLGTWENLFREHLEAENLPPFHQINERMKHQKLPPFHSLYVQCKGGKNDNLLNAGFPDTNKINIRKEGTKEEPAKRRFCKSCKKDISHQSRISVFCSKNYVGEKLAKRCRNKDSNKRRTKKRIFESAIKNDKFLLITYNDSFNKTYSDILHPTEIELSKNWIDKINEIEIIKFNIL